MKKIKQQLLSAAAAGILLLSGCSGRQGEEQLETEGAALSLSDLPTADFDFSEEKYGYRDQAGEWIVEPQFDYADQFAANGLARVQSDQKWGYIKPDGEYAIEPCFDWASGFAEDGFARVILDGKRGYVSRAGEFTADP